MDERNDSMSPAGWYPDPFRRFEFRWFNGLRWTADVSVDGSRFVDEVGSGAAGGDLASVRRFEPVSSPSRTLALLAFIFGVCGFALAWAPFLFVIGGMGGVAGVVLALVALRRIRAQLATGKRLAVAGLIVGAASLGLCVVGFLFTRVVVREITEYTDPGPVDAALTACSSDRTEVSLKGRIDNRDDREHDYVIVITINDRNGHRGTARVSIDNLSADQHREWTFTRLIRGVDTATVTCRVLAVNGPYPFDLEDG